MSNHNDIFWLARYAYNTINPLVEEAKAVEPSTTLYLELGFGHEYGAHHKFCRLGANVHWSRDGMLAMSTSMENKTEVDLFAKNLRVKVDRLKAEARQDERRIDAALATI